MTLTDKTFRYLQWVIIPLGVVCPLTHYFFDWPLSGIGGWAYLLCFLAVVVGVLIYGAVSLIGYMIAFCGAGLALVMIILYLIAYFTSPLETEPMFGFELSLGYYLLAGIALSVVIFGVSFILGRFLTAVGGGRDNWISKAADTPIVLKVTGLFSSVFCVVLLGINIYDARYAIWDALLNILSIALIAGVLYIGYRLLNAPTTPKCPYCGSFNTGATIKTSGQTSCWCNSCYGSW